MATGAIARDLPEIRQSLGARGVATRLFDQLVELVVCVSRLIIVKPIGTLSPVNGFTLPSNLKPDLAAISEIRPTWFSPKPKQGPGLFQDTSACWQAIAPPPLSASVSRETSLVCGRRCAETEPAKKHYKHCKRGYDDEKRIFAPVLRQV